MILFIHHLVYVHLLVSRVEDVREVPILLFEVGVVLICIGLLTFIRQLRWSAKWNDFVNPFYALGIELSARRCCVYLGRSRRPCRLARL